jgi:hypothetical protein
MIKSAARVSSLIAREANVESYIDAIRKSRISDKFGFKSLWILRRQVGTVVELLLISFWKSQEGEHLAAEWAPACDTTTRSTLQFDSRAYELVEVIQTR